MTERIIEVSDEKEDVHQHERYDAKQEERLVVRFKPGKRENDDQQSGRDLGHGVTSRNELSLPDRVDANHDATKQILLLLETGDEIGLGKALKLEKELAQAADLSHYHVGPFRLLEPG